MAIIDPIINTVTNQSILEDENLEITLSGYDVDGDDLMFSVQDNDNASVSIDGSNLVVSPYSNWNGNLEDRRPASNADPYRIINHIVGTLS